MDALTQHVSALPFAEVQRYSALNVVTRLKYANFYMGLPHITDPALKPSERYCKQTFCCRCCFCLLVLNNGYVTHPSDISRQV